MMRRVWAHQGLKTAVQEPIADREYVYIRKDGVPNPRVLLQEYLIGWQVTHRLERLVTNAS
jgi:hypothetical protein